MRRRGQAGRDRLRVLVAGLAEVGVDVDEPWRDDDPAIVDAVGVRRLQPHDRLQDPVPDDDVTRTLAPGRRIDEPGATDVEVGHSAARAERPAVPASR